MIIGDIHSNMERKIKWKLHYKISNDGKRERFIYSDKNRFILFLRLHDLKERIQNNNNNNNTNNQVMVRCFVWFFCLI
jgi:hypothetical protein